MEQQNFSATNSNKFKIILIILFLILIVGISVYAFIYYYQRYEPGPKLTISQNVPSEFLYQNYHDEIPEKYLLTITSPDDFHLPDNDHIEYQEDIYEYYCRQSGELAEEVEFFFYSPGRHVSGGWHNRLALVCEELYYIIDNKDPNRKIYGPFSTIEG